MSEQHPPGRSTSVLRAWWEEEQRRIRNPDGTRKRMPTWALTLLLVTTALLVPLFWNSISEDEALTGTTTARVLPGGEDVDTRYGGELCRGAPVEFEVDGRRYAGTEPVDGECLTGDAVGSVELRYDPDDPNVHSSNEPQPLVYGLLAGAGLGFAATLVVVLRRAWARLTRPAEPTPSGSKPRSWLRTTLWILAGVIVVWVTAGTLILLLS